MHRDTIRVYYDRREHNVRILLLHIGKYHTVVGVNVLQDIYKHRFRPSWL